MRSGGDTVFALSSGAAPAAIAVVRVSGPDAGAALERLSGRALPVPRTAALRWLRDAAGETLDHALVLWFPAPNTATGEDLAELHLHGGRAVVAGVLGALAAVAGCRMAEPGEFTRRAFFNGRIDLAQAEGLADLLSAESDAQRRQALRWAEGGVGRLIGAWRSRLLAIAAQIEAAIEFADDEDDVPDAAAMQHTRIAELCAEMRAVLAEPPAERMRDGVRFVLAGPVNAGKSSLLNALAGREAAIVADVAGTTRDLVEVPLIWEGLPVMLVDSAGIREASDAVERIGVTRSVEAVANADCILWLGDVATCPDPRRALLIGAKSDLVSDGVGQADHVVSVISGEGIGRLRQAIIARARALLPSTDRVALNLRHRGLVEDVVSALETNEPDPLLLSEHVRHACALLDRVVGAAGVEEMLDALFGQFCIGK